MYFNAGSITNKVKNLQLCLHDTPYDFIFINETWLKPTIDDALLSFPNYNLLRQDRTSKKGGGLLVLHKSQYVVEEVRNYNTTPLFEYICVQKVIL